jgi:glycosyltransferase involved in cell wall biosynthesis
MALGTPVLTSDRGAVSEIAGGAALLVDPTDTAAIAADLRRLVGDDDLCKELAQMGLARAQAFDLASYAGRLRRFYEDLDR